MELHSCPDAQAGGKEVILEEPPCPPSPQSYLSSELDVPSASSRFAMGGPGCDKANKAAGKRKARRKKALPAYVEYKDLHNRDMNKLTPRQLIMVLKRKSKEASDGQEGFTAGDESMQICEELLKRRSSRSPGNRLRGPVLPVKKEGAFWANRVSGFSRGGPGVQDKAAKKAEALSYPQMKEGVERLMKAHICVSTSALASYLRHLNQMEALGIPIGRSVSHGYRNLLEIFRTLTCCAKR